MDWDYRIIKDEDGCLRIHQVYYHPDGNIYGMSEQDTYVNGFSLDELLVEFNVLAKAFNKPVIEVGTRKGDKQILKGEQPIKEVPLTPIPDDFMRNFKSIVIET